LTYLLDTNIVSELIAKKPDKNVIEWLKKISENHLYLSVVTIGEVSAGIEKLPESRKKEELGVWLNESLLPRFEGRIVPIDTEIMVKWGKIQQKRAQAGRPISIMDALIAATALVKNFILVTRNEKDFADIGIEIMNPFGK